MIIRVKQASSDYTPIQKTHVDVEIHEDSHHYPSHCYAQVTIMTDHYLDHKHMLQPRFERRSRQNLGEIVLNGTGINKAKARVAKKLREIGCFDPEVPIIAHHTEPQSSPKPLYIDIPVS